MEDIKVGSLWKHVTTQGLYQVSANKGSLKIGEGSWHSAVSYDHYGEPPADSRGPYTTDRERFLARFVFVSDR